MARFAQGTGGARCSHVSRKIQRKTQCNDWPRAVASCRPAGISGITRSHRQHGIAPSTIVNELGLLARADGGQQPLQRTSLYLDGELRWNVRLDRCLVSRGLRRCDGRRAGRYSQRDKWSLHDNNCPCGWWSETKAGRRNLTSVLTAHYWLPPRLLPTRSLSYNAALGAAMKRPAAQPPSTSVAQWRREGLQLSFAASAVASGVVFSRDPASRAGRAGNTGPAVRAARSARIAQTHR